MGLFSFLKKTPEQSQTLSINPYKDSSTNFIYNLLFCDSLNLYKEKTQQPYAYPFDILFSEPSSVTDLQKIIDDKNSDPRLKILAYNRQLASGHKPAKKELLAVIVEVGLENGLDVLASFKDGTARYINQTGKILVWETTDDVSANQITNDLFANSQNIVNQIGVWDRPRLPNPIKGNVRISFLVSDGLYFGEGPMNDLFSDPMASPALTKATELMQYLTQKSLDTNK
ncbi:MAG: hypothetical protein WC622_15750 [Pedobacter sp.]|jgi:hypothetical protein|uniref:hypothetical protein n=1 Tax=Pedobacter sp. TaxID=1411316 RepID=UPI003563DC89